MTWWAYVTLALASVALSVTGSPVAAPIWLAAAVIWLTAAVGAWMSRRR